jgi:hypothetical protein
MSSIFSAQDIGSGDAGKREWDRVVDSCPDAWIWHTRDMMDMRRVFTEEAGGDYTDHSFFVVREGEIVGLVPLAIAPAPVGGEVFREAGFGGVPLPWPCFTMHGGDLAEAEAFAFIEAERRARTGGASRMSFMLSPPAEDKLCAGRFSKIVTKMNYLDISYQSHIVVPEGNTLGQVRERYARYVKKHIKDYDVFTVEGAEITDALIESYRHLHEKDAGRVVRTPRTYREQARMAQNGRGFWTVARRKENGAVAGILQIIQYKNSCYDSSVGVDPDYQDDQVSHLLKWRTIEKLVREEVACYELGEKAELPRRNKIFSPKNFGISFFKEGWSRGVAKTVFAAEKFLDQNCLEAAFRQDADAVSRHVGLTAGGPP